MELIDEMKKTISGLLKLRPDLTQLQLFMEREEYIELENANWLIVEKELGYRIHTKAFYNEKYEKKFGKNPYIIISIPQKLTKEENEKNEKEVNYAFMRGQEKQVKGLSLNRWS